MTHETNKFVKITSNPIIDVETKKEINIIFGNFYFYVSGQKALYELQPHIEKLWEILFYNSSNFKSLKIDEKDVLNFYLTNFIEAYNLEGDTKLHKFELLLQELNTLKTPSYKKALFKFAEKKNSNF